MQLRSILAVVFLLIAIAPAKPATESGVRGTLSPLLYTIAKSYDPLAWLKGADRFSTGASIYISEGSRHHLLIPDFAASADPSVSFDGKRVLFAGKQHSQDPWQIWELDLSEGKPRRITSSSDDCIRPFYLPDDRFVYAHKIGGGFVIEASDLAGGKHFAVDLHLRQLSSYRCPPRRPHSVRSGISAGNRGHAGTLYGVFRWQRNRILSL